MEDSIGWHSLRPGKGVQGSKSVSRPKRSHFRLPQYFHKRLFRTKKGTPVFAGIPFGIKMVPKAGFEPARVSPPPPQDGVSASSTTSARWRDGYSIHPSVENQYVEFIRAVRPGACPGVHRRILG